MKNSIILIFLILSIGLEKNNAQLATMPIDFSLQMDNMRTQMDNTSTPPMDIASVEKDKTRMDNMPMKRDTTPMQMDKMRRKSPKMAAENDLKMTKTINPMGRDSMPDVKKIDPYRKKYGSKYGDKMARNSILNYDYKMPTQTTQDRGVLMYRGRTMIVKNGQKTFIKAYTYLNGGTRVKHDGTIITKNGTKTQMKQGEFVNMMGEIVPMKEQ
jgi:hypothetical protein